MLVVAAGLVLFAAALERLVPSFGPRVVVLALVCLRPLFFQNVARVANDALAVSTGVAGISLLALADGRTLLSRGLLAAVCIAASVWTKQTSFTLIPALVVGLPLIGWWHNVRPFRICRVTCVAISAFLLLVAPLWVWTYQHYGSIVTTQDTLELAAKDNVLAALTTSFTNIAWGPVFRNLFVPGRPWVGGWSFLPVHEALAALHGWCWGILLAAAGAGAVIALRRARRIDAGLVVCAAVVIVTTLGMMYYTVLSHAVFGRPMANPWYHDGASVPVRAAGSQPGDNRRSVGDGWWGGAGRAVYRHRFARYVDLDVHRVREHHRCGPAVGAADGDPSRDLAWRSPVVLPRGTDWRPLCGLRRTAVQAAPTRLIECR